MFASVDMITGLYLNFTFGTAMMTEYWAFAKSFRNVAVWILCRYEKGEDLTYLTSVYIISSV